MSKAQKGNKEKKKPKADKNQPKTHVSAYKAAQDQAKSSFNPPREKDVKLGALATSGARFSARRAMAALELLAGAARASRESNGLSFRKRQ